MDLIYESNDVDIDMETPLLDSDLKYESIDADSFLDSDDKVYIQIVGGGIHIHRRSDSLHYERLEFAVSGEDAESFLENIGAFYCLQKYHDIHD